MSTARYSPKRIGGQQIRRFEFRGDDLVLFPPRRPDGEQRELILAARRPGVATAP